MITGLVVATWAPAGAKSTGPGVTPEQAIAELMRSLEAPLRQLGQPAPPGLAGHTNRARGGCRALAAGT